MIGEGFANGCCNFAFVAGFSFSFFHITQIRLLSALGCKFLFVTPRGMVKMTIHTRIISHIMRFYVVDFVARK